MLHETAKLLPRRNRFPVYNRGRRIRLETIGARRDPLRCVFEMFTYESDKRDGRKSDRARPGGLFPRSSMPGTATALANQIGRPDDLPEALRGK